MKKWEYPAFKENHKGFTVRDNILYCHLLGVVGTAWGVIVGSAYYPYFSAEPQGTCSLEHEESLFCKMNDLTLPGIIPEYLVPIIKEHVRQQKEGGNT